MENSFSLLQSLFPQRICFCPQEKDCLWTKRRKEKTEKWNAMFEIAKLCKEAEKQMLEVQIAFIHAFHSVTVGAVLAWRWLGYGFSINHWVHYPGVSTSRKRFYHFLRIFWFQENMKTKKLSREFFHFVSSMKTSLVLPIMISLLKNFPRLL